MSKITVWPPIEAPFVFVVASTSMSQQLALVQTHIIRDQLLAAHADLTVASSISRPRAI